MSTFVEEVVKILQDDGVGTPGTTLFASMQAEIPTGAGPYLVVIETGGRRPDRIQNQAYPAYQYPSAQLCAFAQTFAAARAKAQQAYDKLAVVRNRTVLGARYLEIDPQQEPFDLAESQSGLARSAFNINAVRTT